MKTLLIITILSLISITISSQDLVVDGKVGIGTSTIGKALEVYGNVVTKATSVGGTAGAFTAGTDGLVSFWTNSNYNPANPGSGWKRTMNLESGNVGIGTSTGNSLLAVYSEGSRAIHGESSSAFGVFGESDTNVGVRGSSRSDIGVRGSSQTSYGVRGRSTSSVGVVALGSTYDFDAQGPGMDYGSTSSRRWKKNIKNIADPLGMISSLRGVYFDWDEEHGGHHDIGFIAEEIGEVIPEIVGYEENGVDATGLDYSKMTPLLVEAANAMRKEYQEKFDLQQSEIDALRLEMAELKSLLKAQVENASED